MPLFCKFLCFTSRASPTLLPYCTHAHRKTAAFATPKRNCRFLKEVIFTKSRIVFNLIIEILEISRNSRISRKAYNFYTRKPHLCNGRAKKRGIGKAVLCHKHGCALSKKIRKEVVKRDDKGAKGKKLESKIGEFGVGQRKEVPYQRRS